MPPRTDSWSGQRLSALATSRRTNMLVSRAAARLAPIRAALRGHEPGRCC
ncbi:MAG TPA: hypothetical protein VLX31_06425 [Streptosporangiaceae bacterium]|nr:hypothetical protein [Streptosporangiaceae bacterium]